MSIKNSERFLPQTYIALTYDCLYDDYATVDVHKMKILIIDLYEKKSIFL